MTVMETTTCFDLYWPSSGCLGNIRASYMHARARGIEISTPRAHACIQLTLKFPRQPDDGQYRPKHVVVSITVIKYTSVIKLCLTTYLFQACLLPRQYDLYQRLQLEFNVLVMMGAMDARNMQSNLAVNKYLHTVASCWISSTQNYDARNYRHRRIVEPLVAPIAFCTAPIFKCG